MLESEWVRAEGDVHSLADRAGLRVAEMRRVGLIMSATMINSNPIEIQAPKDLIRDPTWSNLIHPFHAFRLASLSLWLSYRQVQEHL